MVYFRGNVFYNQTPIKYITALFFLVFIILTLNLIFIFGSSPQFFLPPFFESIYSQDNNNNGDLTNYNNLIETDYQIDLFEQTDVDVLPYSASKFSEDGFVNRDIFVNSIDLNKLNSQVSDHKSTLNGVIIVLSSKGNIQEGFFNFVGLQCIADVLNYRIVLPSVKDGVYFTLPCYSIVKDYDSAITIDKYFDIEKTNMFLRSNSLPPFINITYALSNSPTEVMIIYFVYADDESEIPSSGKSINRESLFPNSGSKSYIQECNHILYQVSACTTEHLRRIGGRQFVVIKTLCVDATLPVNRQQFLSYLGVLDKKLTIIFVNWNGMTSPALMEKNKVPFLEMKNPQTSKCKPLITLPFSDLVISHSDQFLSSWGLGSKEYIGVYIDLEFISKFVVNTTECMNRLQIFLTWWYEVECPNRLAFLTSPNYITNISLPLAQKLYKNLADQILERAFIAYFDPPRIRSISDFLVQDYGFAHLVEVRILSQSYALLIVGPAKTSGFYPVLSYFYSEHVHNFDFTLQTVSCL